MHTATTPVMCLVTVQIIGTGNAKELFYTDSRVQQAYKNYVYMLLTRTNTYTGVQYRNDPTIFSFELMVRPKPCLFRLLWNV